MKRVNFSQNILSKAQSIVSILVLASLLLALLPAPALAVPQIPHQFYGEVRVGSNSASDGLEVQAKINGVTYATTETKSGKYGYDPVFLFPADDPDTIIKEGGVAGDTVAFYVEGISAGSYTFAIGGIVELPLVVSTLPAPSAPTSLTRTTPDNDNTPTFTWSPPSYAPGGVASYEVRIDAGDWANIGDVTTHMHTTALPDGSHTFYVRAVDTFGVRGTAASLTFLIDATPPTTPTDIVRTTPANDTTPTFTWSAATDATSGVASYEVRIDTGSYADIGNVTTYTHTTVLSEGSHTFSVRAKDVAGNTGSAGSLEFTIDITAPAAPALVSPADGARTNDATPLLDWSDVADLSGIGYSLEIDDSAGFSSPVLSKTGLSSSQYELTSGEALSQGAYYWRVRAVDGAGNQSSWTTSRSFTVDTIAPVAPALVSPADGAKTNDTTPTFDWSDVSDPSGVSYHLQVDNDSNFASPVIEQMGLSQSTYTPPIALAEGIYYWRVMVHDGAGNDSAWSTVGSFTVDTKIPSPPSNIRQTTPDNDNTPAFAWDEVADTVAYEVQIDTDFYINIGKVLTYEHTTLADGSHTFFVLAIDGAGNRGTAGGIGFIVDITPPTVPGNITRTTPANDTTPTLTWSPATDATSGVASYEVKIDTGSYVDIGNVTSYTVSTALSEGSHTLSVRAKDAAGNTGSAGSLEFTIDITAPGAPTLVSPADGAKTNDTTPIFDWSEVADPSGISYNLLMDDSADFSSPVLSQIGLVSSQYELASGEALSEGTYHWRVRAVDGAGNEGAWATALSLTIDITPPTVPGNIARTTPDNDNTPTFSWSAATDASGIAFYEVSIDTGSYTPIGNVTTYTPTDPLADGSHALYVRAKDAVGNMGAPGSLPFLIDATPPTAPTNVTKITPDNNNTPTFTWSAATDATSGVASYEVMVGTGSWIDIGNVTTYSQFIPLPDGSHTFSVRAKDAAGNTGSETSVVFTVDVTLPTIPVNITKTTPDNDNTPTFTWEASTDASGIAFYEVSIDTGSYTPIGNVTTYTTTALSEGSHTFSVRAKDTVGNTGIAGSLTFLVDTLPPTTPSDIAQTTPDKDNTPTFTWAPASDATSGVASYEVKIDTGSYVNIGNVTTYTQAIPLSDGGHTFSVRAKDGVGNTGDTGNLVFTIDATPPTAPSNIVKTTPDTDNTPTFIWSAATDATSGVAYYEVRIDADAYVAIGNVTNYTTPSPLPEGSHIFKVRAVDRAGNVGAAGTLIFAISPPLPPPPTTTPLPPNFVLSDLAVSPGVVNAGVPVTVTVKLSNTGTSSGDYQVELVVDNIIESRATGTLAAGTTRTLSFSVVRYAAGVHAVAMGNLTTSFTIPPADIELSDLAVSPRTVGKGDEVRISLKVSNRGGASGAYAVTLLVGGAEESSASGVLAPGASSTILFTTSRTVPSTYSVAVDGLTSSFVVVAPVIEVSIPTESAITAETTTATDATGNPVTLSGNTVAVEETVTGELEIELPVFLSSGAVLDSFTDTTSGITFSGNKVTIPVRDAEGNVALNIVATTEAAVGTGTTARAKVTALALQTEEKETDLSLDDPSLGRVAVSIGADLQKLPSGASLKVTTRKTLSPEAKSGFELVAREENGTIADVGAAIEIERQNLENMAVVGEVRITMKVGADWVNKYGLDKLKVARLADDGTREWLTPTLVGTDAEGRMIFEVVSPNGFSFFSLIAVAPLPAEFAVTDLSLSPEIAQPDEWVEVRAQVSNSGAQQGTYGVVLRLDGEAVDTQSITLASGQSGSVSFFVRKAEEKSYQVQVDRLSGSFQVTTLLGAASVAVANLVISPAAVNVGETVSISVMVTNLSIASGRYDVVLKVNNIPVEVQSVFLTAQETKQVEFHLTKNVAGIYSVDVNGLTDSLTVARILTPATFSLSNLTVEPLQVAPQKPVSIKVTLSNSGDVAGSRDVTLTINGVTEEVKPATLEGQGSVVVTFSIIKNKPGTYQITVDGLSATFTVKKPFNWWLVIGIVGGVVVLAGIVAVLVLRRRPAVT